jgi:hypothetical protein
VNVENVIAPEAESVVMSEIAPADISIPLIVSSVFICQTVILINNAMIM